MEQCFVWFNNVLGKGQIEVLKGDYFVFHRHSNQSHSITNKYANELREKGR